MQYIYHYDIASIIVTFMLLAVVYMRRTYPTKSCRMYKALLWFNLVSSTADLLSSFTISFPFDCPLVLNYALNMTYLASHNLNGIIFLIYSIVIIRGNYGTKAEHIYYQSVLVFDLVAILTTPLTHLVIYFDENRNYCHGPLMYGLYVVALLTLFYSLFLFLKNRKVLSGFQMATDIIFLVLVISAVIIQAFLPSLLIESFCASVAFLMMNVSLDNPAIYLYRNTYCYNQNAFNTTLQEQSNADCNFVAFTLDDFSLFQSKYGDEAYQSVIKKTIGICHRYFGQRRVYYLSNDVFAVQVTANNENDVINKITESGISYDYEDKKITLYPHFCIINRANFIATVGELNDAIYDTLFTVYAETGERVIQCSSEVLNDKHRETEIIHVLRKAIVEDGFDIYYQPIFETKTGKYKSLEALVRLNNSGDIKTGPDEFIPIAEKNGLIIDVGELIFEKICRFWRDTGLKKYGIEVLEINLSIVQLSQRGIADKFIELCSRYGIKAQNINFEITETANASKDDVSIIHENIRTLLDKGFNFSLDDYGSGYSTATYIAEFPFKLIKIDKGILWKSMENEEYKIVLNNAIRLTKEFNKISVVEGVENEQMVEMLISLGCEYLQGYYYSKPLPEEKIIEFLKSKMTE